MKNIVAVFKSRLAAERALKQLESAGLKGDQISVLMTDTARGAHFALRESSKVDEGVAAGAGLGGLAGAILGAVLSASVLVIPGLNLVVTGALASSLAGLGAGAVMGGLVGGLVGSGFPEHEAKLYEEEIRQGNVLVAVSAENDAQKDVVARIFKNVDEKSTAAA